MSDTSENTKEEVENPLGTKPVGKLLVQFSIPGIISLVVGSLYNIVDQIYIGNFVGELGNAATNIAFPLTTLCLSLAALFGFGGAAGFNLSMGRKEKEKAPYFLGNSAMMLFLSGAVIMVITLLFLTPLLKAFGSPDDVLPYAQTYVRITAFGFPFYVFSGGAVHLIRADGRPRASMPCNLVGAIINVVLDTLFVAVLGFGIGRAALATIIGQIAAAGVAFWYMCHVQTVQLTPKHRRPRLKYVGETAHLGMAPCFTQLAGMVVQITMNNSLKYFGGMSIYGEAIPIAVVGIITKVSQIFLSIVAGCAQASQPIGSYNYGARQYARVREAFLRAMVFGFIVGVISFLLFQIFPYQIISLFGEGSSEVYYEFAVRYFRIYLFFTFANFLPIMSANFFTAIGKPIRGTILSLSRQIIFFLPLLIIFPRVLPLIFDMEGVDGIIYVGPIADALAILMAVVMVIREMRDLTRRAQDETVKISDFDHWTYDTRKTDGNRIQIVGAGLAGLSAAITLAKRNIACNLISMQASERAQSALAEGGINAALNTMGEDDSSEQHMEDTLIAGAGLSDPEAVQGLCGKTPEIVRTLDRLGVPLAHKKGEICLCSLGGIRHKRAAYAKSKHGKDDPYNTGR